MNALDTLLQDILAKADAATGYKIEAEDEDYDYIARMTPETTQALVKICRRAVEALYELRYVKDYVDDESVYPAEIALAEINELAKGI